jgi:hypothetical protein
MKSKTYQYVTVVAACLIFAPIHRSHCEEMTAKIEEPSDRIVTKDSNKFIFFGEDDEDITLDGSESGDSGGGTIKYSWHAAAADPENVPEGGGYADESSSGPISFQDGGDVTFTVHSMVGDHDCKSASASLKMSKVTFEYISQCTVEGEEVYSYYDEEDEGTGEEPKIKTKVKVSASGSPGEVALGELNGVEDDAMRFKSDDNEQITDLTLSSESKKEIILETTKQDGEWKFKISKADQ